ncbi:MAG: PEP-CTERM sorting domain-containing protein [Kamptonema sp. SIO4C4]|nr:PEP-CTERM sorting domain-containing protein [Kamptonema sp. SIO4C4]
MARSNSDDPISDGNFLALKIEFLDNAMAVLPGGTGVSIFETQFTSADPLDQWVKLGVGTAPAPAGTAFAQVVIVHVQGPPSITGGSVFVDDVSLVPEPASLSLLAVGGLAMLRRRRSA